MAFILRLLEEEGIYFYFQQHDNKHVMIFSDQGLAHDHYRHELTANHSGKERYGRTRWLHHHKGHLLDQMTPKQLKRTFQPRPIPDDTLAHQDQQFTRLLRRERLTCDSVEASTPCLGLTPGMRFHYTDAHNEHETGDYLVAAIHHQATAGLHRSQSGEPLPPTYSNQLHCHPAKLRFVPPMAQPAPRIDNITSACVAGPAGQSIYTDTYGRIKVQFYWDHRGKYDENSSCWIAILHPWAGNNYGSQFLPRVGQEVLVDFQHDGNPDFPVVIGSVATNQTLPAFSPERTPNHSGFKKPTASAVMILMPAMSCALMTPQAKKNCTYMPKRTLSPISKATAASTLAMTASRGWKKAIGLKKSMALLPLKPKLKYNSVVAKV